MSTLRQQINVIIIRSTGERLSGIIGGFGSDLLQTHFGDHVSLNLSPGSVRTYRRQGEDLVVELIDGQRITLVDWFDAPSGPHGRLYLSSDGMLSEVLLSDHGGGAISANTCWNTNAETWSSLDSLRFDTSDRFIGWARVGSDDSSSGVLFWPLVGIGAVGLGAAFLAAGHGKGGDTSGGGGSDQDTPFTRMIEGYGASTLLTSNSIPSSVSFAGTGIPGDRVVVMIGGKTRIAIVDPEGRWSVEFAAANLPDDGTYTATATFSGNGTTATIPGGTLVIDLNAPPLSVTDGFKSNGAIENFTEHSDGVTLRGTSEPGARVDVTLGILGSPGSVTRTATVNPDGTWSITFSPSEIEGGEREQVVTIVSTDQHGQSSTISETVVIDTLPPQLQLDAVAGDDFANRSEIGSSIAITGTTSPGATVRLQIEGIAGSFTVTTDANGHWTKTLPPGTFPEGIYDRQVTASTTDPAGNVSAVTRTLTVDTVAPRFAASDFKPDTGQDGVLNARERAAGLPVSGDAEAGSIVSVTLNGYTRTATAGPDGKWTLTFAPDEIPLGEAASVPLSVIARDPAGNSTGPFTSTFGLDTIAPPLPVVLETQDVAGGMRGVSTTATDEIYSFYRIDAAGGPRTLATTVTQDTLYNETVFRFPPGQTVPDGSYLLIGNTDDHGNESVVLLIKNTTTGVSVDLTREGLQGFDLSVIDLTRSPDARLAISAQQLEALVGPDNRLHVIGDPADQVTLQNVTKVEDNVSVNGHVYDIYTLGSNGAQVLIDDDLSRTVI